MELVLNTFGTSLSRDNEGFIITHKDGRKRLPVIGIKSIQIGKGVALSLPIDKVMGPSFTSDEDMVGE